jgi:hypothetical protein
MKGHEPLIRVLIVAYFIIIGLILFLVLNQGKVLNDVLSRILVGVLVSTILGVLVFLLSWKGPQIVVEEKEKIKGKEKMPPQKLKEMKKRRK